MPSSFLSSSQIFSAFKMGYYSIDELHKWMGHDVEYTNRDWIYLQVIPSFPSRKTYERVHGPMVTPSGHRDFGDYSVEVDLTNPMLRPVGPFQPYHLRNPQLVGYDALQPEEDPF